jgi:hypothetical protein
MKKITAIVVLALGLGLSAFASPTTLTGILTDDMCTKKHMMPGKPNADCVRECIKHGAKFVVVADGKVVELKGQPEKLNELAGKKIKVTGDLSGKVLTVSTVEAAQ